MSEVVVWSADQAGTYVVTVDGNVEASGSCLAGVPVTTTLPFADFSLGANPLSIVVTTTSGSGFATVTILREGLAGLCWGAPTGDFMGREDFTPGFDVLANRFSRHVRQPQVASNVFILQSGAVVTDWVTPLDPIRVSLFGGCVGQHVSPDDALSLAQSGFAANLVACGSAGQGFGLGGFGLGPFGGSA